MPDINTLEIDPLADADNSVENETHQIAAKIFKDNVLLQVSYAIWNPQATQNDNDITAQGATIDEENFSKGKVWFISPKVHQYEQILKERQLLVKEMKDWTQSFPIRGVRILRKKLIRPIFEMLEQFKQRQVTLVEALLNRMPDLRFARCAAWDLRYPNRAGALAERFPDDEKIRSKFRVRVDFFQTQYADIMEVEARVAEQIRQNYLENTRDVVSELTSGARAMAVKAAEAFVRSLQAGKKETDVISDGPIEKFKQFIGGFDRINFLNDDSLQQRLDQIKGVIDGTENWTRGEVVGNRLVELTQELISFGTNAGAAAAAEESFIERGRVSADIQMTEPEPIAENDLVISRVAMSNEPLEETLEDAPAEARTVSADESVETDQPKAWKDSEPEEEEEPDGQGEEEEETEEQEGGD